MAGSPRGPEPDCGIGSTGRSWTNSVREASWTGPRRSSMPSRPGPKTGGHADRAEPGRWRQEGQQAACAVRGPEHPADRRGVRCEHPRQPGSEAADPRYTRRPLPPRAATASARQLRADKAYFSAEHLTWLRERGLAPSIARPGIESNRASGSTGTAERSRGRSPGCSASAGSPSGASERDLTSSPSSASQPPSPATRGSRNSPRETSSDAEVHVMVRALGGLRHRI